MNVFVFKCEHETIETKRENFLLHPSVLHVLRYEDNHRVGVRLHLLL